MEFVRLLGDFLEYWGFVAHFMDSRFDICIFAKSQAAHWLRSETDKIADDIADDRDNALGLATKDTGDVLVLTASDIGQ